VNWCRALVFRISVLGFAGLQLATAQALSNSQYCALPTKPLAGNKTSTQIIYEVLLKMVDRWNAHDIDGLMSLYWNSPNLLAVIDTAQYDGWQNLYSSYKNQYRDLGDMGILSPTRIQVELLKPDLAFGILSWTLKYPNNPNASQIVGTSTLDLQKFDDAWKIVVLHTSFTEM